MSTSTPDLLRTARRLAGAGFALEPLLDASMNLSYAQDVNDLGLVVGAGATYDGSLHAVMWDANQGALPIHELSPFGGRHASANAVNSTGTAMVGESTMPTGETHPVRWRQVPDGWQGEDLGVLAGSTFCSATDVADDGTIVGFCVMAGTERRGFIWQNGIMTDLGPAGLYSANALNGSAQVVGLSKTGADKTHAFVWAKGKMLDLGTLAGYDASEANAINNKAWSRASRRTPCSRPSAAPRCG